MNNGNMAVGVRTGPQGIKLIQHFESCRLQAYKDPIGIPTIGWGATVYEDGRKVKMGDVITQAKADALFAAHLVKFEKTVLSKVTRPLLQHEFDAAVSFCFNAGTSYKSGGQWKDYDLWNKINKNIPPEEMEAYWRKLAITAGGHELSGLVRRRKAEAHLYATGVLVLF
jgi:lysozyme